MIKDSSSIGERLRMLRKKKELSQSQLGKAIGYDNDIISKMEIGKRALAPQEIITICSFFGVSSDWLLTGTGTKDLLFCNETGLTQNVVDMLKKNNFIADVLNVLLQDKYMVGSLLLFHIDNYLNDMNLELYTSDGNRLEPDDERQFKLMQIIHSLEMIKGLQNKEEEQNEKG